MNEKNGGNVTEGTKANAVNEIIIILGYAGTHKLSLPFGIIIYDFVILPTIRTFARETDRVIAAILPYLMLPVFNVARADALDHNAAKAILSFRVIAQSLFKT